MESTAIDETTKLADNHVIGHRDKMESTAFDETMELAEDHVLQGNKAKIRKLISRE